MSRRTCASKCGCQTSTMSTTRGLVPLFHACEQVQLAMMLIDWKQVSLLLTSCSNESSKASTLPSVHARVSPPTVSAAPSGTTRPRCRRMRWLLGPQCGLMCVPAAVKYTQCGHRQAMVHTTVRARTEISMVALGMSVLYSAITWLRTCWGACEIVSHTV